MPKLMTCARENGNTKTCKSLHSNKTNQTESDKRLLAVAQTHILTQVLKTNADQIHFQFSNQNVYSHFTTFSHCKFV